MSNTPSKPKKGKYFDRRFRWSLLHPRFWGSWLAIGVLVLFGLLPAIIRDPIARGLSRLVRRIAHKPIKVARANLKACFPDKSESEIEPLLERNTEAFVMTLLAQSELILMPSSYIRKRVKVEGEEHIAAAREAGQPIIFIMPHVWGIEYAGLRLNLDLPMVSMAKAHRNELFNWFNNRMRSSQGGNIYMREAGIRALLAELKQGNSFFYLPDEDLGPEQSVFAPFLGTVKATLPVVGRLAQAGNAQVMPVKIGYDEQARCFRLTVMPAIDPESMQGKENEAKALNKAVEQVINAYPEQYMWFLKVLRTRPEGMPPIY
ncbi:lauroyl-Kdo(2)-lipid IV(A) myristoyltransferase [Shewanella algae]|uniref:lauroyl-Kdo(2)-lipid IV(A) myristoyltransferase n=1 Tax=Shewanella algae TaxID=38313 RepID=UPI0031F57699